MRSRQLCCEERKKGNQEISDDAFEEYWKNFSCSMKVVNGVLPLLDLLYLTPRLLVQKYAALNKGRVSSPLMS